MAAAYVLLTVVGGITGAMVTASMGHGLSAVLLAYMLSGLIFAGTACVWTIKTA